MSSGSTWGGVIGAAVGWYVTGGSPQGAQWGWMIGSAIGGYVDPAQVFGPRLQDARQQTAMTGVFITRGWGTFTTAGNIIWQEPTVVEHERTQRQGKGGPEQVSYYYTRSHAIGICRGPITGILIVKENGKVVLDQRSDALILAEYAASGITGTAATNKLKKVRAQNTKFLANTTFYFGTDDQLPDPVMEEHKGVNNVPAYPNLAYMVRENPELVLQGAISQYEFVVAQCGSSTTDENDLNRAFTLNTSSNVLSANFDGSGVLNDLAGTPAIGTSSERLFGGGGRLLMLDSAVGYLSEDHATSFSSITGLRSQAIHGFAYDEEIDRYIISYDTNYAGISTGGDGFSDVALPARSYYGVAIQHQYVVIGTTNGGVVRSTDNGGTFSPSVISVFGGFAGVEVVRATQAGFLAMPSPPSQVATSANGEAGSWTLYNHPLMGEGGDWSGVAHGEGRTVAVTSGGKSMWSMDGGKNWTLGGVLSGYTGTSGSYGHSLVHLDGMRFLATGNGTWLTEDAGATWVQQDSGHGNLRDAALVEVAAMEFPDAPGYYIDANGNVQGPDGTQVSPCDGVVVGDIVSELCEDEGLLPEEYDVSELTDEIPGFRIASEGGADSAIAALQNIYLFDVGEWDGKVRFPKRGGTALFSINDDDLVERDGDAIEIERIQEVELLRRVTGGYIDPAAGYGPATQTWERRTSTIEARGEASLELPATLATETAATAVKRKGMIAWGEPEKHKFSLPMRLSYITPTDVGNYTSADAEVRQLRVMQAEEDSGVRYLESSTNSPEAYAATATGIAPLPPTVTDTTVRGPTVLHVMNLDSLRAEDNVPGVYIAVRGMLGGWQGCVVEMSRDGGVTYQPLVTITVPSRMGLLTADCGTSGEPLEVTMRSGGTISSVTTEQIAAGVNAFAITTNGVSEVGQAQTATALGDGAYELTDVTRGVGTTDAAAHLAGNPFVMLDAAVQFVPLDVSLAGQTLWFRAVTLGTSSDATTAQQFVYEPPTFIIDGGVVT